MNRKGGIALTIIIVIAVLVIGIFIGLQVNKSDEGDSLEEKSSNISEQTSNLQEELDDLQVRELDLIFRYGFGARNELNTFDGTFTKDMIADPPITINLSLTEDELNQIYRKMIEIDFFSYPEEFSVSAPEGESFSSYTPSSSYYYNVDFDSEIKELTWQDDIVYEDEKADMLRELNRLIIDIVEAKEEYKELPVPTGGYY